MKNDFTGDGRADILTTSPWGLGILTLAQNNLAVQTMSANGTKLGGWVLNTSDNYFRFKADFDGDGRSEILSVSPWGIGILKFVNGLLSSIAMAQTGTRLGGWVLNTADNKFLHAADFDRDGKEEILISSPWGIGIIKYSNNNFTSLMLSPNGTRLGNWLLNTSDNFFTLVGDFDGDGQSEILVTSPWGIGILKFSGATLTTIAIAANGTHFGDWVVNTATDRFESVGDFDGDGRAEILVSSQNKIGILKLQGNSLVSLCFVNTGAYIGNWLLDSANNKIGPVGDFDGDGKAEIVISSAWGIGVLELNGNILQPSVMMPNGTNFGQWLLNTKDNRFNYAADFDGDGKAEMVITSPWGIGILKQSGNTFNAIAMASNGTNIGNWRLNTADNDLEVGIGQSYGLVIYHNQWQGAVNNTTSFLRNRGYIVYATPTASVGIALIKNLALYLKAGDRLFVYLAGHGGSDRTIGNTDKNIALTHIFQFNDGSLVALDQFSPSFKLLANKGVDLSVFDGSCDGGETVLNAFGERYCAMSTTSVYAPGITNTPDPSEVMKLFGKPNAMGLWWSQQVTASLLTSKVPHRFYQKIYRNDTSEIARLSLFYKPAIDFYKNLDQGGWDLKVRNCYLYRYIYATQYANLPQAEKDTLTVSAADFLASMKDNLNDYNASIVSLRNILTNSSIINQAANVYTYSFPKQWQTIFGDMSWNVAAEPAKHSSTGNALIPGSYIGNAGFLRMVNEILNLINLMEHNYNRQESLKTQMDNKVSTGSLHKSGFKAQVIKKKEITDYLKYNEFQINLTNDQQMVIKTMNLDRTNLFEMLSHPDLQVQNQDVLKIVNSNIEHIQTKVKTNLFPTVSLDDLIAEFKAVSLESAIYLDKIFYLLTIVEEAVSKVQSTNASPGDLVRY